MSDEHHHEITGATRGSGPARPSHAIAAEALSLNRLGRHGEALALLAGAMGRYPGEWPLPYARGVVLASMGSYDQALEALENALRLDRRVNTYEQRGLVLLALGDRAAARQSWEQALALDPEAAAALAYLACLALEEGKPLQAIDLCSRAIAAEPTLAVAFENRAKAYAACGRVQEAFEDMKKARLLAEKHLDTSTAPAIS